MSKAGGPAFPTQTFHADAASKDIGVTVTDAPGMTIRDYFAGQCLVVLATSRCDPEQVAERAYLVADAMLAAREHSHD